MPKRKLHISYSSSSSAERAMELLGKDSLAWRSKIEKVHINGQLTYFVAVNSKEYDILFNDFVQNAKSEYSVAKQLFIDREHEISEEEKAINGWTSLWFQNEPKTGLRKATEEYISIRQAESDNQVKSAEYHQKRIAYENLKGTQLQPE
tara:strand:- start:65 stop:511 length:447 start_codon:yes stop_codon:yes gene_type:complete